MSLADLSLRHRLTVFFLTAVMVFIGLRAYLTLPRESSPDISIPVVLVITPYPGASPEDVESQVTRPLERELQGLQGLKRLTSTSAEGSSTVTVEFISGTDIDDAIQKVRDRLEIAEVDFPNETEDSILREINFSDIPVVQVHLSGNLGPVALRQLAEDLQDNLQSLPGILRATLVGGQEREVRVEVDPQRLHLYGLALEDVIEAVADENVSIPGGQLDLGDISYAVRVPAEVEAPREIESFVIETRDGSPVFVGDVAKVVFGFEDRTSYARINGLESVALSVQKRVGANIIQVADQIREIVAEEQEKWPLGVEATVLADQSKEIRRMVSDLENNILSGLVLVVLVLMFVLGLRNAIFVGLAIPFSMLLTFSVLQLSGTTLNMIVLFSLVLAVGMLVDNAVVVIENIYRHMQEGKPPIEAAGFATREVGGAIFISTLTTVGAFTPLVFWPGIIGDFMKYLPLTVSCVLLASLVIAFSVNPTICSAFMKVRPQKADEDLGPFRRWLLSWGRGLEEGYRRLLVFALGHRILILGSTVLTFVLVLFLYGGPLNTGIEFFPQTEPNRIFVNVETPAGTRLEKTNSVIRRFEEALAGLADVEVTAASSGAGSQNDELGLGSQGGDPTRGRITFDLKDIHQRSQSSYRTLERARALATSGPGVTIDVDRPQEGPPVGDPLSLEVSGDDFATLGEIAARIRGLIDGIPGLVSLDDDFDLARPEVRVLINRTEAARLGLTTAKIARTVRTAVNGTKASLYRYGEDDADIVVRLREEARSSPASLGQLTIVNESGDQIPLSSVAQLERSSALTSITHKNQKRVVTVSGKVTTPQMAEPVRQEARRRIEAIPDLLPVGYQLNFAGQSEDEAETTAFLLSAFLFGVLIVLCLMVAKFDSVVLPGIILTAVLMSMIGVLLGLVVTGMPFGIIMTGLGVISLAGIVVNNAIVLLDYGEQQWRLGVPRRDLVVATGLRRLRPVLLTAVTTILGLVPLSTGIEFDFRSFAFATGGESSQWWQSMGVAVIFGLSFATFLTLVLVPVLYDFVLQWRERKSTAREPKPQGSDAPTPEIVSVSTGQDLLRNV
ncbi:MAG: efflux RND transporter permease subunit [Deltaproteobacteria bacterium]|nr:efflux RND transporter permease subunit [Deltaproteobacteria bacterium]